MKACLFDPIIAWILGLLQGWAMMNLSHGGRLTLIKSMLQATPLHLLQQNAAKYDGVQFSTNNFIFKVQRHIRTLYAAQILTSTQWKGDLHQAVAMGFVFRPTVPWAPRVVRWATPSPAWFKLNLDRSSLGNPGPTGAVGIVRDAEGQVRLAYQDAFGTTASVIAELTAV
ncbi:UNVERIFIED_CONTAM: hypothetical protein Slati_3672700 [Sesamum latifolium]|uniref:RNase H type-1 domain-containing protein n=1 Tax=Sesamum latifolium TaxID=2727402 RepID=A0AAW2U0M2_9LAMI